MMNTEIVYFNPEPEDIYNMNIPNNCDYKIVKFLNSLGGYQFYVFESYEIKAKTKAGKTIPKITDRLRKDNFRNLGISATKTIELYTKTPEALQVIIEDLISSYDVLMYDPLGDDADSKWHRLVLENNDCIKNNFSRSYENKISFSFSTYVTREL